MPSDNIFAIVVVIVMLIAPLLMYMIDEYNMKETRKRNEKTCKKCPNYGKGGCYDGSHVTGNMWKQPGCTAPNLLNDK